MTSGHRFQNTQQDHPTMLQPLQDHHLTEALVQAHISLGDALQGIEDAMRLGAADLNRIRSMLQIRDDLAAQLAHVEQTARRWQPEEDHA